MTIERINHWARRRPDALAFVHDGERTSYRGLARAVEATRRALAANPSAAGLAVVLSYRLYNAWVLDLALRALGLTTVAVGRIAYLEPLNLGRIGCIVAAADEIALLREDPALQPGVARIAVNVDLVRSAAGLDPSVDLVQAPAAPRGGHILYTSGTTGAYKKVRIDAAKQAARDARRASICSFTENTTFHALDFGLWTGIGFNSPSSIWHAGGTVVVDQTERRYADFLHYRPNYAQTLPTSLDLIVKARDPEAAPVQDLILRCGGSLVPLSLAERAVARVSRRLVVGFSSTEVNAVTMMSEFHTPEDLQWLTPVDPERVQVVDESGAETPPGEEGELRFRLTDLDVHEYLDDPAATARAFRDGCFYPGDLAMRREDGRVRILGRAADVLNVKGQKRPVGPMEQSLQEGLGVEEVCLFLGMTAEGVEELVVAVRARTAPDKDDVARRLGPSAIFERVRVEVFEEFPRTRSGTAKTDRSALRRMVFPAS